MIREESVGAVVFNNGKFLLLKYGYGHWGFVKGNVEKNEAPEKTLRREMFEETGIKDYELVQGFNEQISYFYKKGGETVLKTVVYFLVRTNKSRVVLSHEHEEHEWLGYDEAFKKLSFENTKQVLNSAKTFLEKNI